MFADAPDLLVGGVMIEPEQFIDRLITTPTVQVEFTAPDIPTAPDNPDLSAGFYVRIRVSMDRDLISTGFGGVGEVEDYFVLYSDAFLPRDGLLPDDATLAGAVNAHPSLGDFNFADAEREDTDKPFIETDLPPIVVPGLKLVPEPSGLPKGWGGEVRPPGSLGRVGGSRGRCEAGLGCTPGASDRPGSALP